LSRAISRFGQRCCSGRFEGIGWGLGKIAKRIMPYPSGPTVIPTTLGFSMLVDPCCDPVLETALYYHGIYEEGTLDVMRRVLRPGDTFIDVGANLGLMTLWAARLVGTSGHVHAFEPQPDTYAVLERHLALNGVRNVTPHPLALGAAPGRHTLYERSDVSRGAASMVRPEKAFGQTTVELDTLDHVLEASQIGAVRMLKIDVEGWELEVLRGARRLLAHREAPVLCVESSRLCPVHEGGQADVYDVIRSINDYRVYTLVSLLRMLHEIRSGQEPAR
jgi:FkbM family methyltransferase